MSQQLISRSPDLKRLRDEGYDVALVSGYLILRNVPYVNGAKEVLLGVLVSELSMSGDITAKPANHVAMFAGEAPCDRDGYVLNKIINGSAHQVLAEDLSIDHTLSSKPPNGYTDYHEKMATYAGMLAGPASAIDPSATARVFPVVADDEGSSVFNYLDTASSRAQIVPISAKLGAEAVAIVGLGGTGAYVLDLLAKTPVREIHLFDDDTLLQHNAFRSPGAPSINDLRAAPSKVDYFADRYSAMHRGIIPHGYRLDHSNAQDLARMEFVFLAIDGSESKEGLLENLSELEVPFIDVGMGLYEIDGCLGGQVRVTTCTPEHPDMRHIPLGSAGGNDLYDRNIQVADLNCLNASLAVVRWKKLCGFYSDLEREHNGIYVIDGNTITNEDRA